MKMSIKEQLIHDINTMDIDNIYIFCRWFSVYYKVNFEDVMTLLRDLQKEGEVEEHIIDRCIKEQDDFKSMFRGY